jgi:hypothetical protein
MATSISNVNIQTLGQKAVEVFAGSAEELGAFATDFNTSMGLGDTLRIPVATAGTASNLVNFAGDGSSTIITVPVALNSRFGDIVTITDEQLSNLGPAWLSLVKQQVRASIIATLKNAHSLVTTANFTLPTGIVTKAASAWTIDDFATNVGAVLALNKLNPASLYFIATPGVFTQILAGLKNVYAFDKSLSDALVNANTFKYAGVTIVRSTNLPAAIKGGYFCDGTHIGVGFGIDKLDTSKANAPEVEAFVDASSGLGYTIRAWYDPNYGYKMVPYVITGAAVANANGAVIPVLT